MPSAPTAIAQLVVTALRGVGKAAAASGRQMVKNFQYKPEGVETTSARTSSSGGKQNARVTEQMNMSIEEAQMILNVKKEDSMENIQKSYERIFAANGPPPPPTAAPGQPAPPPSRKLRTPSHSHYLQSKVFRALERIKAERGDEAPPMMNGDAAAASAPPPPPSGPSNPGSSS